MPCRFFRGQSHSSVFIERRASGKREAESLPFSHHLCRRRKVLIGSLPGKGLIWLEVSSVAELYQFLARRRNSR
ncbi:unnamed protein product [Victoria cruziana]